MTTTGSASRRYPGRQLRPGEVVPGRPLRFVAEQVGATPEAIAAYGTRAQTRSVHLDELREAFGFVDISPAVVNWRPGCCPWRSPRRARWRSPRR